AAFAQAVRARRFLYREAVRRRGAPAQEGWRRGFRAGGGIAARKSRRDRPRSRRPPVPRAGAAAGARHGVAGADGRPPLPRRETEVTLPTNLIRRGGSRYRGCLSSLTMTIASSPSST